ncbi:hypothetical protein [Mucilaginibacter sp.]|uniref:hypothetical protein n=1 Tax=Mucilaginibacter sp. TaxID=1882438 RepID=UPI0026277D85|nr:hypothetical protein [Mucilaginibacter sp.]
MIIQVPWKAKTKLSAIVKDMRGEIISISTDKQAAKKASLLNQIKQGLEEVKKIQEGKAKFYSISDIFDGK